MSMDIILKKNLAPARVQIAEQIQAAIACGNLHIGEVLPPARELARDLQVPVSTTLWAYAQLEADGWCTRSPNKKTTVTAAHSRNY